jgi:2-methylcitrate dehydratase PrpD
MVDKSAATLATLNHAPNGVEPLAQALAKFVTDLSFDDLPPHIVSATKALLCDQLSVQIVGSTMPWVAPALALAKLSLGARPESTVVNEGRSYLASEAAFVNATYGQACELDDSTFGSAGHVGTATIPAAIAMGEREAINGRALITAVVAGYEVMFRLMASIRPHHNTRGFHSQGIGGPFAAAAAAGKIIGLTSEQMTHALAIAGSHSCGPLEFDQSGGEVKRVHAGIAARAGVNSALLAQFGLTGPITIIEGERGFCRLFSTQCDLTKISGGLGEVLNVGNAWLKLYPATAPVHTSIMAATRLMAEHAIKPHHISKIKIAVAETSILHGGGIRQPQDVIGAQFSFAFSVALRFIKGRNDVGDYMDSHLWQDDEIVALMKKVELSADPAATGQRSHMATLTVILENGTSVTATERYPIGTPANPATSEQLFEKVVSLAGRVMSSERIVRMINTIDRLEEVGDVRELADFLAADKTSQSVQ